jgi:carbon monoxide dehydrogenase subunit G
MRKLVEQDLEWVERAPVRVEVERTIAATPEQVFAAFADHANWSGWFKGIKATPAQGTGLGSTRHVSIPPLKFYERFIAWDPGQRYSFIVLETNAPGMTTIIEDYRLAPTSAGGTQVSYVMGLDVASWMRPLTGLLRRALSRQIGKGLDGLNTSVSRRPG